jgi:hypothetical protein
MIVHAVAEIGVVKRVAPRSLPVRNPSLLTRVGDGVLLLDGPETIPFRGFQAFTVGNQPVADGAAPFG